MTLKQSYLLYSRYIIPNIIAYKESVREKSAELVFLSKDEAA